MGSSGGFGLQRAAAGEGSRRYDGKMWREALDGERIFVVHDLLTVDECARLLLRSEDMVFERGATVDAARTNDRVQFDDVELAEDLFARVRRYLPGGPDGEVLVGFSERWRFYRYDRGQTFAPHRDGAHHRLRERQMSRRTFMVYLSDDLIGGETRFFRGMEEASRGQAWLTVAPCSGKALIFDHHVWHEGAAVASGRKVVLRTDVMYGRVLDG